MNVPESVRIDPPQVVSRKVTARVSKEQMINTRLAVSEFQKLSYAAYDIQTV